MLNDIISQRVQVSLWYILIGYFGGLSIYHNDTWTLWVLHLDLKHKTSNGKLTQVHKSLNPKPLNP